MNDNWKNRSEGMQCNACMWYVTKLNHIGRCRRHAPRLDGYPVVFRNDSCGDFKLDERSVKTSFEKHFNTLCSAADEMIRNKQASREDTEVKRGDEYYLAEDGELKKYTRPETEKPRTVEEFAEYQATKKHLPIEEPPDDDDGFLKTMPDKETE